MIHVSSKKFLTIFLKLYKGIMLVRLFKNPWTRRGSELEMEKELKACHDTSLICEAAG